MLWNLKWESRKVGVVGGGGEITLFLTNGVISKQCNTQLR